MIFQCSETQSEVQKKANFAIEIHANFLLNTAVNYLHFNCFAVYS